MNYIHQIKGFWIAQEFNQLGTSEVAMYFYLLEIWNKANWAGSFHRNNYKVMADLSIKSYKTLQSVRDRMKAAGIISFKQRNGDANVEYTMADLGKFYLDDREAADVGKFYQGSGEGLGKGSGEGSVEGSGEGAGDLGKNYQDLGKNYRHNINLTESISRAGAQGFVPEIPSPPKPTAAENVQAVPPAGPVSVNPNRPKHAPTWDHVEAYFGMIGQPAAAAKFFDYYESNGWVDNQGRIIQHWPSKANTWMSNDAERKQTQEQRQLKPFPKAGEANQANPDKLVLKTPQELLAEREERRRAVLQQQQG